MLNQTSFVMTHAKIFLARCVGHGCVEFLLNFLLISINTQEKPMLCGGSNNDAHEILFEKKRVKVKSLC